MENRVAGRSRPERKRAVIYDRLAARDHRIEAQHTAGLRELAESLHCEAVATFTDWGSSGTTVDRPGLQGLLAYVEGAEVDYLMMRDVTRLSRNFRNLRELLCRLDAAGVTVVTQSRGLITFGTLGAFSGVWDQPSFDAKR